MTTLPFTFDLRHAGHLIAQIDGRAYIGGDGVEEVQFVDLITGEYVTVGGAMAADVIRFLTTEDADRLNEAIDDARAGALTYSREIARAAE